MLKFKPEATKEQISALTTAWEDFRTRYGGLLGLTYGRDLGLRDGNMSIAAVFDFVDEDAFRAFDLDEYHNRLRRELLPPIPERADRCQFHVEGAQGQSDGAVG
jgi:hypothetical protein